MLTWTPNDGWKRIVPKPRLHLDADASIKALLSALTDRGHDVTRTPTDWIAPDPSDEDQLLAATAQGRCIFTFNVRDFVALSASHPHHGGIVLAAKMSKRPHVSARNYHNMRGGLRVNVAKCNHGLVLMHFL